MYKSIYLLTYMPPQYCNTAAAKSFKVKTGDMSLFSNVFFLEKKTVYVLKQQKLFIFLPNNFGK